MLDAAHLPHFRILLPLIRKHLYPPDGKPPADWSDRRDASILKHMLRRHPVEEIAHAIEGLALLRDFPDQCPDQIRAFHPGQKLTLRPLWAKTGERTPMMTLALRAWWAHKNKRTPSQARAMFRLGDILRAAMTGEPLPPDENFPVRGKW